MDGDRVHLALTIEVEEENSMNERGVRRNGVHRVGPLAVIAALVVSLVGVCVPTLLTHVEVAGAASALNPPPLCSVHPAPPCVQQPLYTYTGYTPVPMTIDMPTLQRETIDAQTPYSGRVTFAITNPGTPPAGYAMRPPFWANPVALMPIDADPNAAIIYMYPETSCSGRYTCTYLTTAPTLIGGWYSAGHPTTLGLAGENVCPPSLNLVYGCSATMSQSAVYVPQVSERQPPQVAIATAGAGLTAKAIAGAFDPYGQAMTLTWDFGDGTSETGTWGTVVSHTYANYGAYQIVATAATADGRYSSGSADAGVLPPAPKLLSISRVPSPGGGPVAVAAGLVQGWPAGSVAMARYWTTGCPADPTSNAALNSSIPSSFVAVTGDGAIDVPFGYLDAAANAAVLEVHMFINFGGRAVELSRTSECVSTIGSAAKTTGATGVGATEVPVDSASVAIGHTALIDAGTAAAERRLVTGHGSLIVAALSNAHASDAVVLDLGAPVAPLVLPPPPADPVLPGGGSGGGSGGGTGGGSAYVPVTPARLLETRTGPGVATVDGVALGGGLVAAGSVVELPVAGRGGVVAGASAVVLNVTVTGATSAGYVTVWPCGVDRPNASSLNFGVGDTIPNAVVVKVGVGGKVCLFTSGATYLLADVNGYFPAGSG
ncbi:MAG: PKD domain-containing protein [Ilumatobacteraceae bacterium]